MNKNQFHNNQDIITNEETGLISKDNKKKELFWIKFIAVLCAFLLSAGSHYSNLALSSLKNKLKHGIFEKKYNLYKNPWFIV